jgi:hypothetical protein
MLVARIYGLMCLFVMAGAVAVYLTDSFNFGTTMILGFIASILAGAGMLTVYPALMREDVSSGRKASKETKQKNSSAGVLQGVS